MSQRKKRKVHYGKLAVLIGICAVIIAGIGFGISSLFSSHSSLKEPAKTAEKFDASKIVKPEEITQETFDALIAQAEGTDEKAVHAQAFLKNISAYSEDILAFYLRDDDRYDFAIEYPNKDNYQQVVETIDEGVDTVPALLQWDLRWGYQPYGDWEIWANGCAPTCLSMVASYLNQDPGLTPKRLAELSDSIGDYGPGQGTLYTFFEDAAIHNGLNVETISVDPASIEQAISEGKVLVFHLLPGKFTTFGHFVVVPEVVDGQLKINDPNSIERSSHTWSMDDVLPETATIWAYSKPEA